MPEKIRDPEYCFDFIEFEVQEHVFRVPQHPFEDSVFFRALLHPEAPVKKPAGSTPRYTLDGVTPADFRYLLRILVKVPRSEEPKDLQHDINTKLLDRTAWMSALRLAKMWEFGHTYREMIACVGRDKEDCVLRLAVGMEHDFALAPRALQDVASRSAALELDEYQLLGIEFAVKVANLRELYGRTERYRTKDTYLICLEETFGEKLSAQLAVDDLWGIQVDFI